VSALQAAHDDVLVDGRTVAVGALPRGRGTVAVLAAGTSDGPVAAEAALTAAPSGRTSSAWTTSASPGCTG
jgi:NCAIR mutase (PurE)-related protein